MSSHTPSGLVSDASGRTSGSANVLGRRLERRRAVGDARRRCRVSTSDVSVPVSSATEANTSTRAQHRRIEMTRAHQY